MPEKAPKLGRRLLRWWCGGVVLSLILAIALAIFARPQMGQTTRAVAAEGDERQTIDIQRCFGAMRITVVRDFGGSWSAIRAAGAPDTNSMGDIVTAWASATPDGQPEWLELDYAAPISASSISIFETHCPGALTRVTAFNGTDEIEVWSGVDPAAPNAQGIWQATIPVSLAFPVSKIRIYLDSPRVAGWNEIDAVGLIDQSGKTHWATEVRASSTYATVGQNAARLSSLGDFAPRWAGLPIPLRGKQPPLSETRMLEARGWPMLMLWGHGNTATNLDPLRLYHPIWLGLFANGAFWGAALALLYACTIGLRRFVRESLRLRRGCCMRCGYDLRYDIAAGCPECGWRREPAPASR